MLTLIEQRRIEKIRQAIREETAKLVAAGPEACRAHLAAIAAKN